MKAEDIRRLYHQVDATSDAEWRDGKERIAHDPTEARRLIATLIALAASDPHFARLLGLFERSVTMALVQAQIEVSDQFALIAGRILLELMESTARPARGKPGRKAKTA